MVRSPCHVHSESDVGLSASVADSVNFASVIPSRTLCLHHQNGFIWLSCIFFKEFRTSICSSPFAGIFCCIVICFIHFAACALWGFNLCVRIHSRGGAREVCIQFLRRSAGSPRSRCNLRQTRYNCVFLRAQLFEARQQLLRKKNQQARTRLPANFN